MAAGAVVEIIAPKLGEVNTVKGMAIPVDKSLMTVSSVLYDAVYIPGGPKAIDHAHAQKQEAIEFISQAYKHCKAIAFESDAEPLIQKTTIGEDLRVKKNIGRCYLFFRNTKRSVKGFYKSHLAALFWEREKSPV